MTEDESTEEICTDMALSEMLAAEYILFVMEATEPVSVMLVVNCNDLFAWGCADAQEFLESEILDLYRSWKSGKWGVSKWCCRKRNQRPQAPIERDMRKDGAWDESMEALPLNTLDAEVHAQIAAASYTFRNQGHN